MTMFWEMIARLKMKKKIVSLTKESAVSEVMPWRII
jgi:hypothetical protein